MKNISDSPNPEPKITGTAAKKKPFIVIEVPRKETEHEYPRAIFACETLDEALDLCKQMNADAGAERYGVQRPATRSKHAT